MNAQTAAKHATAPQTPSLPDAKPESLGLSTVRLQRMSDAFKREVDEGNPAGRDRDGGAARPDRLVRCDRHARARRLPRRWRTTRIFRIFSMTKPIVSVGIMMLIEDGHFILSDPVAKFIPEFADQKVGVENNGKLDLVPLKRQMTVQDLLRHTSGTDLRPHRQRPGAAALSAIAAAQPQDHQRRTRDAWSPACR